MRTTTVYNGQENLCALAPNTRLRSWVRRGRIISLSYFGLAPNADPTGLSSSVFLVAIARYWLAFQFKSSLPFLWFLLNQKNWGGHWCQSQRSEQREKARRSKLLDDACRWAWKAHANHSVFWSSPLDKQILLSSKPSTKRPVYAHKNLQTPPPLPRAGPSMVQLVRGSLIESLDRGSNPLVGAPHV